MINRKFPGVCKTIIHISVIIWLSSSGGLALERDEIVVLANTNTSESIGLAKYYMEKRNILEDHLIKLRVTDKEWCSREEFQEKVIKPVRQYLKEKDGPKKTRCLVTLYGLPLRVEPPAMNPDQQKQAKLLKEKQYALGKELEKIPKEAAEKRKELQTEINAMNAEMLAITKKDYRSSFDSELSLVLEENYDLKGWVNNPYFLGFKNQKTGISKENVLMVSRLDGPDASSVKRIINDSIQIEQEGLKGVGYFDARWPEPDPKNPKKNTGGYAPYDLSIHLAAKKVREKTGLPVVVDDTQTLFQPGECPDAALYCGWYSHHQYVDAFNWQRGAVGYHIASSECGTLKNEKSQVWCKKMIEKGVAATLGPVGEPYLQAFPVPEMFFSLLVDGYLSLAECYILSMPFLSWQMVLIGDPLYTPFKIR